MATLNIFNSSAILLTKLERKYIAEVVRCISTTRDRFAEENALPKKSFKVPKRIERTSVDILQALSNTVKRDPSASHYMFYDDPYLYPNTFKGKKMFAMSKESGIKAAQWVMKEHPELFTHTPDDPIIKTFLPKATFTEESDVSEDILKELIDTAQVSDSIVVYEFCQKKNIALSEATKQSLLELVCFYNCEDDLSDEYLISKWFEEKQFPDLSCKWKTGNFAEDLFRSFENPPVAAYCAMICGLARHNSVDKAWSLYYETKTKEMTLDTTTYNQLLRICNVVKASEEAEEKDQTLILLQEMSDNGIPPNVQTLNSLLEGIHTLPMNVRDLGTQKAMKEFHRIGIQPNLTTYSWVIMNLCYRRRGNANTVRDILQRISKKEIELQESTDGQFFTLAMASCDKNNDKISAIELDDLLNFGNNRDFLNGEKQESIYHTHLLNILVKIQTPEVFIDTFRSIVPSITSTSNLLLRNVIQGLTYKNGFEYIPEIASENMSLDTRVLKTFFAAVTKFQPEDYSPDVKKKFGTVINTMINNAKDRFSKRDDQHLEPELLEGFVNGALKCCEIPTISSLLNYLVKEPEFCLGTLDPLVLKMIMNRAVEDSSFTLAESVLNLWVSYGYPDIKDLCNIAEKIENLPALEAAKIKSFYTS